MHRFILFGELLQLSDGRRETLSNSFGARDERPEALVQADFRRWERLGRVLLEWHPGLNSNNAGSH
jgi:hypothetical protein